MPGPIRTWTQAPFEPIVGDNTNQWMQWVTSTLAQLQPQLFPMAAPVVTIISQPNAVQIVFNEVVGARSYAIYETAVQAAPPGVPLTTIPANHGAISNSWLRSGLNDTVTRFYFVQAFDTSGNRGTLSTGTPGAALSGAAAVVPVSQNPVNQGGVGGGVGGGGALPGVGTRRQPL